MKIFSYDILDGASDQVELPKGTVITFGEGLDRITAQIDPRGRLRIASTDKRIIVEPDASNCFYVETKSR